MNLQNAARFLEIAKEAERKEAGHHAALSRHFTASTGNGQVEQSGSAREAMMQHAKKREAVTKMVDIISAFAAAILQSPADYPAHMIDYAHGLIAESTDYANKERGAVAWASP
jgi:hypothetical protein